MGLLSLLIGIVRTVVAVLRKFALGGKQPLRVDLPFPFIPLDIVFPSDPNHIQAINHSAEVDHLHAIDTKKLPKWTQWYFSGTHFHNGKRDKWFLAFEPSTIGNYPARRAMHDTKLARGFTQDDVKKVAQLVRANADEDTVADAVTQLVIGRILLEKEVPRQVVQTARNFLKPQITDALIPGNYAKSKQAQETVYQYCAANVPAGVEPIDVVHAFGSVTVKFAHAITVLKDSLDTPVDFLFTRAKNCPTPNTPRVVVATTTLDGLLSYPAKAGKTVIINNIAAAAEFTQDLFFTLGAGEPGNRVCSFKGFFVDFMTALQTELKSGGPSPTQSSK